MIKIETLMKLVEQETHPYLYTINEDRTKELFLSKTGNWEIRDKATLAVVTFDRSNVEQVFTEMGLDIDWFTRSLSNQIYTYVGYHQLRSKEYLDKLGEVQYNNIVESWNTFGEQLKGLVNKEIGKQRLTLVK